MSVKSDIDEVLKAWVDAGFVPNFIISGEEHREELGSEYKSLPVLYADYGTEGWDVVTSASWDKAA